MGKETFGQFLRFGCEAILLLVFGLAVLPPIVGAQQSEEFDSYGLRLEGFWLYSSPSGTLQVPWPDCNCRSEDQRQLRDVVRGSELRTRQWNLHSDSRSVGGRGFHRNFPAH